LRNSSRPSQLVRHCRGDFLGWNGVDNGTAGIFREPGIAAIRLSGAGIGPACGGKWVESGNGSLIIHSTIFAKLNPVSEGLDH
jgi:hypothetical protein